MLDLNDPKYKSFSTREDELDCIIRAKNGDKKAREEIVNRNLHYIYKVAKKYKRPETNIEELIAPGVIGLLEALDKFKPSTKNRFLTYAHWKILEYIFQDANLFFSSLYIPPNKKKEALAIYRIVSELEKENGATPTVEEVYQRAKKEGYKVTESFVTFIYNQEHLNKLDPEINFLDDIEEE